MQYWGKLFGLIFGIASGAGFWGIVIGVLLGHLLDKVRARGQRFDEKTKGPTRQALFFRSTFQVLGHLTKAKGRVTETDIQLASQLMDRMQLHGEARLSAQRAFREGKQPEFPLRETLRKLRRACFGRFDLIRMFLEIQLQAAFADGELHPNERTVLFVIAEELGISRVQFEQFLAMMEGGRHFDGHQSGGHYQQRGNYQGYGQPRATLADACKVLGVNEQDDATTIKRAYRKLMSEHHPDKLVAKGLPPEMMELAKQKAQSIQAAYDLIKKEKGFK
ncbi:Dna-J like membrane chaperone protein [Xenorhabdus mauleonii]|uniref:Co-chaperone protein DjlA n=1 Tax=Xenorhabdus mauleonii TaxID=351675 RepID=A0A1I3RJ87_9GAMM|nr:co-chaperone DjlA [Xenorhabdus mauleonii]PHM39880.1 Dna-J like membrane chaperone protein [Xenorhabdus mauleonii]SFJ45226.1 DnaJ like chaperone protein [Xenorhabdus mauleonii]